MQRIVKTTVQSRGQIAAKIINDRTSRHLALIAIGGVFRLAFFGNYPETLKQRFLFIRVKFPVGNPVIIMQSYPFCDIEKALFDLF